MKEVEKYNPRRDNQALFFILGMMSGVTLLFVLLLLQDVVA